MTTIITSDSSALANDNNEEKLNIISKKTSKKRERSPSNNLTDLAKKNLINNNSLQQPSTSTQASSSNSIQTATPLNQQSTSIVNKKEKQRPETWNKIEQQIFFNALRQNGKNFEAITQYFNNRQKRYKIDAVQRSKEQIRHFYYRTWHKIIKYISLPTDTPIRDIQIRILIAFNALMNKSHRWNKKSASKVVELINHGWTTVRDKANNVESNVVLPQLLKVSLEPKNEMAFCRVQKLAQNPYLMIDLLSSHTIKYLISYLENKWKDRRLQFFEKVNLNENDGNNLSTQQFILYPDESHNLSNLEIESNIYLATSISNQNDQNDDENNIDQTNQQITTITSSNNEQNISTTIQSIKIRLKSSDENENLKQNKKVNEPAQQQKMPLNNLNDSHIDEDDAGILTSLSSTEEEIEPQQQQQPPQPQPAKQQSTSKKLNLLKSVNNNNNNNKKITQSNIYRTQFNIEQLKSGLTVKSDVTFIQLFLALNKPNIIKLKYEWQQKQSAIKPSSDPSQTITNIELIDNQRFYLQVLAKVAESYLSEIKIQNSENSNEARLIASTNKKSANQKLKNISNNNNTGEMIINAPSIGLVNETNKTQKLLEDMSSKARKLRQKKAIVVKSTRMVSRESCESPTPSIMSPCPTTTTTTSSSASSSSTTSQTSNIVLSAPVAAVARQIVNTSNDYTSTQQQQQQKKISSNNNNINQFHNNNCLIGYQDQQFDSIQQDFSNIIPQIFTSFLNENNKESDYSSTYSDNNSLNNVILHSNLILSDDQTLLLPQQHQQQQDMLSTSTNNDLSLIDISLNTDFCLNENSNMSSLSTLLGSLQCKSLSNGPPSLIDEHRFIIPSATSTLTTPVTTPISISNSNIIPPNIINYNNNQIIKHHFNNNNNNNNTSTSNNSTSLKRSDTLEWNDCMSDISLNGFLNEMQSPEKRTLLNLINDNSRDSLFFNMDTLMDTMITNNNDQNQNMMCKLNGQFIDTSLTPANTNNNASSPNNSLSAFTSTIAKN